MVIWLIGLSGAGKTTVGRILTQRMRRAGRPTIFLDGDDLRAIWGEDLTHTIADRRKNHERISQLCALLDQDDGLDIVVAALSIFPDLRHRHRKIYNQYFEVFLDLPVEGAQRRDPKGIYRRIETGKTRDIVGVDLPFPRPENADLHIAEPEIYVKPEAIADIIFESIEYNINSK